MQEENKEHQKISKKTLAIAERLREGARGSSTKKEPVLFDVREPVTSFTALSPGRQDMLDQVASSIQKGIVVISGLGGVGKSELATSIMLVVSIVNKIVLYG